MRGGQRHKKRDRTRAVEIIRPHIIPQIREEIIRNGKSNR